MNGRELTEQLKLRATRSSSQDWVPKPNSLLLDIFTLRPDDNSKHLKILIKFFAFSIDQKPMKIVSSAYWRCEMIGPWWGSWIPSKIPFSYAISIAICNPSAAIIYKKGDSGSPCLIPRSIQKFVDADPLMRIDTLADDRHPCIHVRHLIPKSICCKIESKYSQLRL